jgi:hypothetical protein
LPSSALATGKSKELVIDNALSKFQGEDRERASARLGEMFDSSDEILDDRDLPGQDWQASGLGSGSASRSGDQPGSVGTSLANSEKFPAAMALLQQAETISGVPADDLADIRDVSRKLSDAVANDNGQQVMALCQELDDILFYVEG